MSVSSDVSFVNVFDSENITNLARNYDADLGSPNAMCGSYNGGPNLGGHGRGGEPFLRNTRTRNPFANCDPLGNLLIIQKLSKNAYENENKIFSHANDGGHGGCMDFRFYDPLDVHEVGLLDARKVKQTRASITVSDAFVVLLSIKRQHEFHGVSP